jgi:SAM-dependent methyltransferase
MLTTNEIKTIYEARLLNKEPVVEENHEQLVYLLHFLPKNKNSNILDAGCGNGNFAFNIAGLGYKNIFAIDLFEQIPTEKFKYLQSSITDIPFKNGFFDLIYSFSVIYYLQNPDMGIKEFNRTLKNGGILILTAHTRYSLFTLWRNIKLKLKFKDVGNLKGVKFYSTKYYERLLQQNGFEILRVDGYGLSFIIYPFYRRKRLGFKKYFGFTPPLIKSRITQFTWLAKIKSVIGYHFILIAKKKDEGISE